MFFINNFNSSGAYYMHIMSNIQGIDLENLEKKVMRSGAYSTLVPAVRAPVSLLESGPRCWREWQRAASIAGDRAVVKYTVPGPMTMMDGMVDLHYKEDSLLAGDLVKCINQELLALVKAGCKHVQIDEPVLEHLKNCWNRNIEKRPTSQQLVTFFEETLCLYSA